MAYRDGGFRRGGFRRDNFRRNFPREMTKIKCSECGKEAEVPFKPIEGRPVYCKDCFMKKKGITPRESREESEEEVEEKESGEETGEVEDIEEDEEDSE